MYNYVENTHASLLPEATLQELWNLWGGASFASGSSLAKNYKANKKDEEAQNNGWYYQSENSDAIESAGKPKLITITYVSFLFHFTLVNNSF